MVKKMANQYKFTRSCMKCTLKKLFWGGHSRSGTICLRMAILMSSMVTWQEDRPHQKQLTKFLRHWPFILAVLNKYRESVKRSRAASWHCNSTLYKITNTLLQNFKWKVWEPLTVLICHPVIFMCLDPWKMS